MPRWAWLAALTFACGQPTTSAQPPRASPHATSSDAAVDAPTLADDLPRLAQRARQLYVDWAAIFADPALDCAIAAERLSALAERNADVAAANKAVFAAGRERVRALRAELEKYEGEMGPIAKSIMESPIMGRCAGQREFATAIDRLQGDA